MDQIRRRTQFLTKRTESRRMYTRGPSFRDKLQLFTYASRGRPSCFRARLPAGWGRARYSVSASLSGKSSPVKSSDRCSARQSNGVL